MKRNLKWLAVILLTPIVLFLLLAVLLYFPPVQNWAVKQVVSYASEQTGMEISVENVRLAFPLDLEVNGFKMTKPVGEGSERVGREGFKRDTIADVKRLVVDVSLWPLLKKQVEINALELNDAKVNTTDFISSVRIKGDIGRLYLQSHGIDMQGETVKVNVASLENAKLDVALNDSVPEDTTQSEVNWRIDIDDLAIDRTDFTLHMPGDTMSVYASMEKAVAKKAYLGLKDGIYKVSQLDWNGGVFNYDQNFIKHASKGFDSSHIALTDVNIGMDSVMLASPRIAANVRQASFKEKSGLQVNTLSGKFTMDDQKISLPDLKLRTPGSALSANFQMDFNTFAEKNPGNLSVDMDGYVSKNDIQVFAPDLPKEMMRNWPDKPLSIKGNAKGNLTNIRFRDLQATLPTAFDLKATGWVANPTDSERIRASVNLKGKTEKLDFIVAMLPPDVQKQVKIPRGIGIDGNFKANGQQYTADFTATEGDGNVHAKGFFDAKTMAYSMKAKTENLHLEHFVPNQGLSAFTGEVMLQGHGTDFLNPNSGVNLTANVRKFRFQNFQLDGIGGDITLRNGLIHAKVDSKNTMLGGAFNVDGKLTSNEVNLYLMGKISRADLKQLGLMDQHYVVSADANVRIKSDLKKNHSIKGHLGDFALRKQQRKDLAILLVNGDFDVDGTMHSNVFDARFDGMITRADLYQLGIVDQPFTTSFGANLDIDSNLDDYYKVNGLVCNLSVQEKDRSYYAGDVTLDVLTRRDTTHAVVNNGDFYLNADASGGYKKLLKQVTTLTDAVQKQLKDKNINQPAIREKLPNARLVLESGNDNIFAHLLKQQGYIFRHASIDLTSSHTEGLNGTTRVGTLTMIQDSITLDSIDLALTHEDEILNYRLQVINQSRNNYPFKGNLQGSFNETGLSAQTTILDMKDKKGLDLGLLASMEEHGVRINVASSQSVIGYKKFSVNEDNYIYIGDDRRVLANMKLLADDGAGAYVYTDDTDSAALQNITLSMHKFDLEKVFQVLPFAPLVSGVLDGDFHVIQRPEDLTVSGDMTIRNLFYEHSPMGNVGTQLVYMPQSDGSHYIDAIITKDENEVGILSGTYKSEGDGYLDADFVLDRFPLNYVNGFIPDQIVGLRGTGEGELTVKGPLNKLDINGEVYLDSSYLYSDPYGLEMRFANDPVRVQNSKLLFENFEMFANNDSPLNIQGSLDFSDMNRMMLDVRMRAQNFLLIDAKENPRSEAYGKAYVNFFGRMNGPLERLNMRGKLDVLGNTDMTYVLKESVLATDNELDELVKFTDFNDSTKETVVVRPDITGFNMDMDISIDEQAHIVCALNADHSNYIDLIGGGELNMTFDPTNDLRLNGRYTLSNGEMKYALPVIPLRTFEIQEGSYIEFTGDPMNPTLNITATERLKTNVADGSASGKMVDFDCGVSLTQTMSKPTIEFIIKAPEDMQVQNELNTKSTEERGKLAVSMLASGMYLGDGSGTASAAMSGALASFMQSEINNITGSALRSMGLDLSANMETSTDASGSLHTDYTFKFSKRLWNNRLRIIMGGRVSTGSEVSGDNGAFFDNFSMEYRLNQNETQYLKLFYERDAYDWLEGELSEFGAGFMWRRKLSHFKDIFNFKPVQQQIPVAPQRRDSVEMKK
ncbi:MAG: translocation/assembly module TamB domain-containing protein [Prevotella sp.]|nr:translocation/assembly module TamB domain-containing protein [Prevotella sp.]